MNLNAIYVSTIKRVCDFSFALLILILFSPFIILLCVFVFIDLGRPVFFVQTRTGKGEKSFQLLKFRTFRSKDEFSSISRFGGLLRATSLDETPQLINIILGEMSFVGPRPLLPEYLNYYSEVERKRHLIRPGLTGLSQIKLGNSSNWEQRLDLDVVYFNKISFIVDLDILMRTIIRMLKFNTKRSLDYPIERFDEFAKNRK